MWTMRHTGKANFLATSRASESSLLLGSHFWDVHNDSAKCSTDGKRSYTTKLILHTCNSEQFACANAFCIMMNKRCDGKEDCVDGTDEQNCQKLIRRQGYKKELTPLPEGGGNVSVKCSLTILDIEVEEAAENFRVKASYTRDWFDGRLTYKHLKRESGIKTNALLDEERESIWFPYLIFNNVRIKDDIKSTDIPHTQGVIPNADFSYVSNNNMHLFKGSENALRLTKSFNNEWKCDYAYKWYPFDTQICRMEFVSMREQTEFHPFDLQYNPNISLNCYTLRRIEMCRTSLLQMEAIVVAVTMGRPIISNLLTVFAPTMLLIAISFTTRFFAEDYIDMVIQVNLTILLVLATM